MNKPVLISSSNFQDAWAEAIIKLKENRWTIWNLVVQITNPLEINQQYHEEVTAFAKSQSLIPPNQVAYTIFPFKFYQPKCRRDKLYKKIKKYFNYTRTQKHSGWGTYYERMIWYCPSGDENKKYDQLGNIIDSINNRPANYGASYFMIIPYPEKQATRLMGAPCLNYVTVQVETTSEKKKNVSLLAVYRNHDFLERAYGNYYGLCKLLEYIASETNSTLGVVTCVSSHAYAPRKKTDLWQLARRYRENVNA